MCNLKFVGFCHCGTVIKNDLCLQVFSLACLQYICFHGWTVQMTISSCSGLFLFFTVCLMFLCESDFCHLLRAIFNLTTAHLNISEVHSVSTGSCIFLYSSLCDKASRVHPSMSNLVNSLSLLLYLSLKC